MTAHHAARYLSRGAPALLVTAVILVALHGIWLPASDGATYPWSSDALGHLIKADYLRQEIAAGHLYPNIFPSWYNGIQLMRYYPPLPYYLLVAIDVFSPDMIVAGHWFVVLTTLAGALSFLLFARWTGRAPAVLGAILFALAPDTLRVALAEGNLPRALATAMLPALTYCLLRTMSEDGRRRYAAAGALLLAAIILSHAMMGAIFGVGLGLLALLLALLQGGPIRRPARALGMLAVGLALSGVWLLPSLSGGISDLNQAAVTEALAIFPLSTYLNPLLRFGDREILYVGLGLSVVLLAGLLRRSNRRPVPLAFCLVGFATVLISTFGFNELFNALPFHQLFWPIRFLSFSALALTAALAFQLAGMRGQRHYRLVFAAVAALLLLDTAPSLELVFRRAPPAELIAISQELTQHKGWRVATLDFSRLGSAPSYLLSAVGRREQVFGWAYQGARTATNVAALNGALEGQAWPYALTALNRFGTDDVVVLNDDARLAQLSAELPQQGFAPILAGDKLTLYHRDGGPRAYRVATDALGIGNASQNFAILYPGLTLASSAYIDDFDPDYLARFHLLVLSGFRWHDQQRAEEVVRAYADRGGQVLVDLNGIQNDPLAREPRFLGVYGEIVRFSGQAVGVNIDGQEQTLLPFAYDFWQAVTPQGKLENAVSFDYHGVVGSVLGWTAQGRGRLWFVGLNLPFHTLLTGDPLGIAILSTVMTVPAGQVAAQSTIPLEQYRADRDGYGFEYALDQGADIVVPVADHGGTVIQVDGQRVESHSLFNMVGFSAPAGRHTVTIRFLPTTVYTLGAILSLGGLLGGVAGLLLWNGRTRRVHYVKNQAQRSAGFGHISISDHDKKLAGG